MESVSLKYNNAGVKTGPSLQFLPEPEIFDKGRQDVKCKIFTARHEQTDGEEAAARSCGEKRLTGAPWAPASAVLLTRVHLKLFCLFAAAEVRSR